MIDEGMASSCATRNALHKMAANKPLESFRFFISVDLDIMCAICIVPDLKQFTAANSVGHPSGYADKIVVTVWVIQ